MTVWVCASLRVCSCVFTCVHMRWHQAMSSALLFSCLKRIPPAPHLHLHDPGPHCHPAGEQQETLPGAQLRSKGDLRKRGWRGQHDGGTGEARHTVPHSRGGDRHTRQQSLGDAEGTRGVTSAVSVISRRCPMKPEWKKLMFILCNFHCAGPRPPFHNRDRARRM